MPKFDPTFAFRDNWTWSPFRSVTKNSNKSEQKASGDSTDAEPNQRKASDKDESDYKRVEKKFKCPTEPFLETLRLLDEIL